MLRYVATAHRDRGRCHSLPSLLSRFPPGEIHSSTHRHGIESSCRLCGYGRWGCADVWRSCGTGALFGVDSGRYVPLSCTTEGTFLPSRCMHGWMPRWNKNIHARFRKLPSTLTVSHSPRRPFLDLQRPPTWLPHHRLSVSPSVSLSVCKGAARASSASPCGWLAFRPISIDDYPDGKLCFPPIDCVAPRQARRPDPRGQIRVWLLTGGRDEKPPRSTTVETL